MNTNTVSYRISSVVGPRSALMAVVVLMFSLAVMSPPSPVGAVGEAVGSGVSTPQAGPVEVQVSAGGFGFSCGLHADGTLTCWGLDDYSTVSGYSGTFKSIDVGHTTVCGIRPGDTVECWGNNDDGQSTAPSGTFESVSIGYSHACGVRTGGTLACWGSNDEGESYVPPWTFEEVSVGNDYSCGLRSDATLWCWGKNDQGQSTPPSGTFKSVSAGDQHACGIRDDDTIACWGLNHTGQATPPTGTFKSVSAGNGHTCGIRTDGSVVCWGWSFITDVPTGVFRSISNGYSHACGVRANGTIVCWGSGFYGSTAPPSRDIAAITTGYEHTCVLSTGGTVTCWFDNGWGRATPPAGSFKAVSAGYYHSCGIRTDETLSCWGRNDKGQTAAPAGNFKAVSAGWWHTCALTTAGQASCWGDSTDGRTTPPSMVTFKDISAGADHTCGVRVVGTVSCWGKNDQGQTAAPTGTFKTVSAGDGFTCGLLDDGTVTCWGKNDQGQTAAPTGKFKSVSAGGSHACGVRADSAVTCWGLNNVGQATPLPGSYASVSAGNSFTCGVRTDSVFQCWGEEAAVGEPFDPVYTAPAAPAKPGAAAGNASAAVIWSAPGDGGSPITGYTVTSTPGNKTCSTTGALTCTVTGLTSGTSYTFKVRATNAIGDGPWSAASDAVTPTSGATAPAKPAKPTATAGNKNATVTWTAPSNGGSPITGYTVRAVEDTSKKCTTTGALTCTVTGLTNGTAYTFQVRATNAVGNSPWSAASDAVTPTAGTPSGATYFHPIAPTRLIDPRPAWKVGPFSSPWTKGLARDVQVTGEAYVPANAKAVVLNVTVTDVTSPGGTFISVYPKGGTRPNVSSLNAASGQTIANSVTTKIGDGGKITIYNEAGTANVIVDVAGYYTEGSGDGYVGLSPTRVIDSRPAWKVGPHSTPWNAGQSRDVTIDTSAGVPASADAVVLNVTATDVTAPTFITVYPKGAGVPNASNINLAAGNTIANQVVVKLGTGNQVSVYNEAGKANVIVDVVGYYKSGSGDAFYPVIPQRIIDPRPAWQVGPFNTPWGNKMTRPVQVTTNAGVPASAKAVVMNVTATDVTQGTFVTVFPGGTVPNASNLNAAPGWTIANAVTAKLSIDGKISVYNEKPTANIIVDVNGYFS